MNIIIKGLHMELTDAIETYLKKKLRTLEKFVDENTKLEVVLGKNSKHHKSGDIYSVEIKVKNKSGLSFVAQEGSDLYSAIDDARDELAETLASKKDKKKTLQKKGAQIIKKMAHGERVKVKKQKRGRK